MRLKPVMVLLALAAGGATQAPGAGETLQYVVIVTRHGVRSPTWTLGRLHQYSAEPWPDFGVPPGYLTPHGRKLMTILGAFYREYFAVRGLHTAGDCAAPAASYFRADADQRTRETAAALAETMRPGCKTEIQAGPEGSADALFDPIEAGTVKPNVALSRAAVLGKTGTSLEPLVAAHKPALDALHRILNGDGKARQSIFDEPSGLTDARDGIALTGPLRLASTFSENLLLEYANGMEGRQLGWGRLNATNLLEILSLHTVYADLMRRTPQLARTRGSNLMTAVVRSLEQAALGKPVPGATGPLACKVLVISGHDTNLSNLSGMLGLSWIAPSHQPDDIPPGAALLFSLWRQAQNGRYLVRLQFVTQTLEQMRRAVPLTTANPPAISEVFIPGCSSAAQGWPCEWSRFRSAVERALE